MFSLRAVYRRSLGVSIDQILISFVLIFILSTATGHILLESPLLNGKGAILAVLLGGSLIAAIRLTRGTQMHDLVLVSGTIISIFALPRISEYLWAPDYVNFPFPKAALNAETIANALGYICLGTMLFFSGLLLASAISVRSDHESAYVDLPAIRIRSGLALLTFVVAVLFELMVVRYLEISPYGKTRLEEGNQLFQLIRVCIALDEVYFAIVLAILFSNEKLDSPKLVWLSVYTLAFVGLMVSFGSRSVMLKVMMMIFAGVLVKYHKGFVLSVRAITGAMLAIVLAFAIYPFATEKRIETATHFTRDRGAEESTYDSPLTAPFYERIKIGPLLRESLDRLGQIDYAVLVLTQEANTAMLAKYMNVEYLAKSIANNAPGTPFPEAELSTSRVLNIVYRGFTEEYVKTHGYEAQIWTMWGLSYSLLGWWGGLLGMFGGGLILGLAYSFICQWSFAYQPWMKAWFLFSVPPLVIFTHGIDHSVNAVGFSLWQFLLPLFVLVERRMKISTTPRSSF